MHVNIAKCIEEGKNANEAENKFRVTRAMTGLTITQRATHLNQAIDIQCKDDLQKQLTLNIEVAEEAMRKLAYDKVILLLFPFLRI